MLYKKIIILSLSLLLISCGWFGMGDSGSGTEDDPYNIPSRPWDGTTINAPRYDEENRTYHISDATHFAWIMKRTNDNDSIVYDNETLFFANDIDMDNRSMQGIRKFQGTLDGNYKSISNIRINRVYAKVGLIGQLIDNGTIKNLTIIEGAIKGRSSVGGVVGWAINSKIINVVNRSVRVEGSEDSIGGIVGFADNVTIELATNYSKIIGVRGVGGIVGNAEKGSITKSVNLGEINGRQSVGGIVGYGKDSSISLSHNNGQVVRGKFVGGIFGSSDNGTIENSSNLAKLQGVGSIGGIIGYVSKELTINHSYNYGLIFVSDSIKTVGRVIGEVEDNTLDIYSNNYYLEDKDLQAIGKPEAEDAGIKMDVFQFTDRYNFDDWDFNSIWTMQSKCPVLQWILEIDDEVLVERLISPCKASS